MHKSFSAQEGMIESYARISATLDPPSRYVDKSSSRSRSNGSLTVINEENLFACFDHSTSSIASSCNSSSHSSHCCTSMKNEDYLMKKTNNSGSHAMSSGPVSVSLTSNDAEQQELISFLKADCRVSHTSVSSDESHSHHDDYKQCPPSSKCQDVALSTSQQKHDSQSGHRYSNPCNLEHTSHPAYTHLPFDSHPGHHHHHHHYHPHHHHQNLISQQRQAGKKNKLRDPKDNAESVHFSGLDDIGVDVFRSFHGSNFKQLQKVNSRKHKISFNEESTSSRHQTHITTPLLEENSESEREIKWSHNIQDSSHFTEPTIKRTFSEKLTASGLKGARRAFHHLNSISGSVDSIKYASSKKSDVLSNDGNDSKVRIQSTRSSFNIHKNEGGNNFGLRLTLRKALNEQRRRVADYSLAFAMFGLACMVLEGEMIGAGVYNKDSLFSYFLRSISLLATIVLVTLVIAYYALEVKLFSVNNCIEDWRIAINSKRLFRLFLEVLACAIQPLPVNFRFNNDSSTDIAVSVFLTLPMFLRLYLIFRVLLLRSNMFTDTSSRSIGALNRVKFDIRFILKTLMTICPGKVLIIFICSWWLLASWIMRACERIQDPTHDNILNTMWLVAITLITVGYGDLVPKTYCGRGIAVLTGVMGSGCTALVVAVFARKLELKNAEKHVHNFMLDNKIYQQLRHAAANVLRETWLFYKYTRLVKRVNVSKVRTHQRKFLYAIHSLRKAREEQRKIKDDANSIVDLSKTQGAIYEMVTQIRMEQKCLKETVEGLDNCLHLLKDRLDAVPLILHNNTISGMECARL